MIRKKLTAILLVVLLVSCSTLSDIHTIHARASSGALSLEAGAEVAMLIYSLLETAMIASGVKEGLDDYASGKSLYDAFRSFANSLVLSPDVSYMAGTSYTLSDGSTMSYQEDGVYIVAPDGSTYKSDYNSAVFEQYALPDEEAWRDFRVIEGGSGSEQSPKDPFNELDKAVISTGFISMLGQFVQKMQSGDIAGIEADDYYDTGINGDVLHLHAYSRYVGYTREYNLDFPYAANIYGIVDNHPDRSTYGQVTILYDDPTVGSYSEYVNKYTTFVGNTDNVIEVYNDGRIYRYHEDYESYCHWNSDKLRERLAKDEYRNGPWYHEVDYTSTTIPIFPSAQALLNYLNERDKSEQLTNISPYQYDDLSASAADTMAPLAGVEITPGLALGLNHALSAAVQAIPEPEPASDPVSNTQVYKETVAAALEEAVPQPDPDSNPDPTTDPSQSDPSVDSYKVDLTMIFPFCLPFDLMRLLEALSAEPEAPCFQIPFVVPSLGIDMVVDIDLAFLDSVMEIFRAGILITFIIGLIYSTSKLIRW